MLDNQTMTIEMMVEFRMKGPMENRLSKVGKYAPGETVLMRVSQMLCLFPDHRQIRTTESGWTVEVFHEDWPRVEKAFRSAYLGGKVHAV
jgi:hypothetical protein